jgi:hypothetical protein
MIETMKKSSRTKRPTEDENYPQCSPQDEDEG